MNEVKMRGEFEAWLLPTWSRKTFVDSVGDTQYVEDWVQGAWIGWVASRAALAIELPKPESDEGESWDGCWKYGVKQCREAIEAAGLQVTP